MHDLIGIVGFIWLLGCIGGFPAYLISIIKTENFRFSMLMWMFAAFSVTLSILLAMHFHDVKLIPATLVILILLAKLVVRKVNIQRGIVVMLLTLFSIGVSYYVSSTASSTIQSFAIFCIVLVVLVSAIILKFEI